MCLGRVRHHGILQAPKFQKFQLVEPNKICSRLGTAEQVGQNELQWKDNNIFYKCIEGKLVMCLLLAMFIGED